MDPPGKFQAFRIWRKIEIGQKNPNIGALLQRAPYLVRLLRFDHGKAGFGQ